MLPSKTIPEDNRKSQGRTLKLKAKTSMTMTAPPKKKVKTVRVEEVEDEDSAQNLLNRNASVSSVTGDVSQKKKVIAAGYWQYITQNISRVSRKIRFICFTRLFQPATMANLGTTEIFTTVVSTALTRSVPSKKQ